MENSRRLKWAGVQLYLSDTRQYHGAPCPHGLPWPT